MFIHETALPHAISAFPICRAPENNAIKAMASGSHNPKHYLKDYSIGYGGSLGGSPSNAPPALGAPPPGVPAPEPSSFNAPSLIPAGSKAPLSWKQLKNAPTDELWWFNGETPPDFQTDALLKAIGYKDYSQLSWHILLGADKVCFSTPPTGANVIVETKKGSDQPDDIMIGIREGNAADSPTGTGTLTVRQPKYLIPVPPDLDHDGCPPNSLCPIDCPAHWTEIKYQVFNNLGEIIENVTVNERFPGPKTNDELNNDWVIPSGVSKPYFQTVKGIFTDLWAQWCGSPLAVGPKNPTAYISIDQIPHEFNVGSTTPGQGVRVQMHIAHRYLGYTRHEKITSPAL